MAIQVGSVIIEGLVVSSRRGGPVRWAYVPIDPGLTVLYGLNGAGKSLILESLRACLSGIKKSREFVTRDQLLVRLSDESLMADELTNDPDYCEGSVDALAFYEPFMDFENRWALPGGPLIDIVRGGRVWGNLVDAWVSRINMEFSSTEVDVEGLVRSVVAQRTFLMQPHGVTEPLWAITPAIVKGFNTRMVQDVRTSWFSGSPAVFESWKNHPALERVWDRSVENTGELINLPEIYEAALFSWDLHHFPSVLLGTDSVEVEKKTREVFAAVWRRLQYEDEGVKAPIPDLSEILALILGETVSDKTPWGLATAGFTAEDWVLLEDVNTFSANSGINRFAALLSGLANWYYGQFLLDAPTLELFVGTPLDWLQGRSLSWVARRDEVRSVVPHVRVPIVELSQAEQRWAVIAINLALTVAPSGVLLIDEPEQGLHRSAEAVLARRLSAVGRDHRFAVVAASHAPELLNQDQARVLLVRRHDQGLVDGHQVVELTGMSRAELLEYGMLPSDLLRRQKGFLIVEGQHDLLVFEELIGAELASLRVEILPMRGARNLKSVLDSRVLFDFTDAHLFVTLDALDSDHVRQVWIDSVRLAKIEGDDAATRNVIAGLEGFKADEARILQSFLTRAIEHGLQERFTPVTLGASDVLDYLPVTAFVPDAVSWSQLRDECERGTAASLTGTKFKQWLVSTKRVDLSDRAIREACAQMGPRPPEFTGILATIEEVLRKP